MFVAGILNRWYMIELKDGFQGEQILVLPKLIVDAMEADPLLSRLHITDIGYFPKALHHRRERKAPINQFVFIYCIDGGGWYRVGEHTYTVTANQYFILPAGVPHAYGTSETTPWTIYWIHFKGEMAPYYAKDIVYPMDLCPSDSSRISDRIGLFEEMFMILKSGYSSENLLYVSSLFHYFLGSLRYVQQYRNASNRTTESDTVERAIHYMKENMEKHVSLQDLAALTGYSPSYFSAMFRQKTGHSPSAYSNLLKIQYACSLLDTTDMKINQICYKVGIGDMFYFSRLFSKIMGMSPKEYRRSKKG